MTGDPRTLRELFMVGVDEGRRSARILYFSDGSYKSLSTAEFEGRVNSCIRALAARGIVHGDRVALISYNRPEWAIVDYACQALGAVSVPLYSTLTADQVEFILGDSGTKIVFAENEEQVRKLAPGRRTVTFDSVPGSESFEEFLKGSTGNIPHSGPDPDDLATIIYTSGTTGVPKGVRLSHRNLASNAVSVCKEIRFTADDVSLSFLPLSHAFQRIVDYAIFLKGATIAYAESTDTVIKNLGEVNPSILCAVPRFYEKVNDKAQFAISNLGGFKGRLTRWALAIGALQADFRRRGARTPLLLAMRYGVAKLLVLNKFKAKIGSRLRLLVSGGAPLGRKETEFFYSIGCTLLEGYGLTETSPVITVNRIGRTKLGTVGQALPGIEVKFAEDGEILVRGPNVMLGYHNRPEETAAVLKDGWFSTGDIGEMDPEGYLRITDRKKDLLKTSGGKYIAPGPIENRLRQHPFVANAVLLGDRHKFAAALLVPDFAVVEKKFPGIGRAALTKHAPVLQEIQKHVDSLNESLAPHESVKRFALLEHDFTLERGELTPTMKVKRRAVEEHYKDVIQALFG